MRVVVTGGNRGIGLELVRQLLARGDEVHATYRNEPGELAAHWHRVDVTGDVSVLAQAIDAPVDVLINNAGINRPHQKLHDLDLAMTAELLATNALAALSVTVALLPLVRRGTAKKIVHISSLMGSIADNQRGASYGYRMSKAALNMMSKSLAIDLRDEGILSIAIHPGWVQTGLGGPDAPLPVADSVRGILARIDAATLADSGRFVDYKGTALPF